MTDLTADLESSGIPTLDHRTYVMKVFFPGVVDHPILHDPKVSVPITPSSLRPITHFFVIATGLVCSHPILQDLKV